MSTAGEEGEEKEGTGSDRGGTPPREKEFDIKVFEESPPHDAEPKEFRYTKWFIDNRWRVIAEPPPGRKSGKTKAFVWKINGKFSKKTQGRGDKKEESLIASGFLMDADLYMKWDKDGYWTQHAGIQTAFKKTKRDCDARKSKSFY